VTSMDPERERVVRLLIADVVDTLGPNCQKIVQWELPNILELTDTVDSFAERLVEEVQQYILDSFIDTTWPSCPRHPKHPLWFHDGAWWCEQDGVAIVGLGELYARGTGAA